MALYCELRANFGFIQTTLSIFQHPKLIFTIFFLLDLENEDLWNEQLHAFTGHFIGCCRYFIRSKKTDVVPSFVSKFYSMVVDRNVARNPAGNLQNVTTSSAENDFWILALVTVKHTYAWHSKLWHFQAKNSFFII